MVVVVVGLGGCSVARLCCWTCSSSSSSCLRWCSQYWRCLMRALSSSSSPFFCLARALISWRIFRSLRALCSLSLSLLVGGGGFDLISSLRGSRVLYRVRVLVYAVFLSALFFSPWCPHPKKICKNPKPLYNRPNPYTPPTSVPYESGSNKPLPSP